MPALRLLVLLFLGLHREAFHEQCVDVIAFLGLGLGLREVMKEQEMKSKPFKSKREEEQSVS